MRAEAPPGRLGQEHPPAAGRKQKAGLPLRAGPVFCFFLFGGTGKAARAAAVQPQSSPIS